MRQAQFRRSGKQWFVSDGLIWDDLPATYRTEPGRPLECSSKLHVYNPQVAPAAVTARFYHTDRPPTEVTFTVGGGEIEQLELAKLPEIPHKQAFWIAVESDVPVLPQAVHADYTFWDPVPDAIIAVAPYPGPLRDETSWVFPDCYESEPSRGWYEYETLTMLNPGKRAVKVHVRYLLRYREGGAEETVEVPAERVVQLDVWRRFPKMLGTENGPPVRVGGDYAVRLDASGPVIAQTTRRARWVGRPSIIGARSTMAIPLRELEDIPWYYPGGAIVDRGVLPRANASEHPLSQCDNTWNLLFVHNLDGKRETRARITFHSPDGSSTTSAALPIPGGKSILECLHGRPWLGEHTAVDRPFAMTVRGDTPVAPEVTCAEFEMWSQVCPGAMSAVNLYPGPLTDERVWWLGIGRAGGADDVNTEWNQTYHLFNPGETKVKVVLSFLGLKGGRATPTREVVLAAGAVARVDSKEVAGLPVGQPFAVRAEGSGPFCAQVFGRTFTRGLPFTRAMYSLIGLPMRLAAGRRRHQRSE